MVDLSMNRLRLPCALLASWSSRVSGSLSQPRAQANTTASAGVAVIRGPWPCLTGGLSSGMSALVVLRRWFQGAGNVCRLPGQSRPCNVCRWRQNSTETVSPGVAMHVTPYMTWSVRYPISNARGSKRGVELDSLRVPMAVPSHSQAIAGFWNPSDGMP